MMAARRNFDDLLEDLAGAVDAAAELVALGQDRWEAERPLRLAGEAVVGRLGDIATNFRATWSWERVSCLGLRSKACGSLLITHTTASTTSESGVRFATTYPS